MAGEQTEEQQKEILKEISVALDLEVVNASDKLSSETDAAVYLREKLQPIAEKYDIEIGAYIESFGGKIYIRSPQTTFHNHTVNSMNPRLGLASFHTHQTGHFFSGNYGGDLGHIEQSQRDGYLSNKNGLYRYRQMNWRTAYNLAKKLNRPLPTRSDYFDEYNSLLEEWEPVGVTIQ